jgi:exosortase
MVSLALFLCFSPVFFDLVRHALNESLHSHIILVPFISAYLIGQLRPTLPRPERGGLTLPLTFALLGGVAIVSFLALKASGVALSHNDYLSLNVFAFCMLLFAAAAFLLGSCFLKSIAFPAAFLLVMVPLPDFAVNALEIASQHASAEVYSWMMNLSGATYFRDERTFVLPNLTIVVAQECSGIRSSLVLFLVSLVAGHMFLRTTWKKWALAIFVFPLGIFRNAFRIYFLSMASAHWNPDIIHSPLHHRGGPIFFALSLIPFFLVLFWLRKSDSNKLPGQTAAS